MSVALARAIFLSVSHSPFTTLAAPEQHVDWFGIGAVYLKFIRKQRLQLQLYCICHALPFKKPYQLVRLSIHYNFEILSHNKRTQSSPRHFYERSNIAFRTFENHKQSLVVTQSKKRDPSIRPCPRGAPGLPQTPQAVQLSLPSWPLVRLRPFHRARGRRYPGKSQPA